AVRAKSMRSPERTTRSARTASSRVARPFPSTIRKETEKDIGRSFLRRGRPKEGKYHYPPRTYKPPWPRVPFAGSRFAQIFWFQIDFGLIVLLKEVEMAKAKNAVPEGFHTVTPQLTLDNAAPAIEWYKQALGAEEVARAVGPDGKIMHAELRIGDSIVMLNDAMGGGKGPKAMGGSPSSLWIYVEDCDALFNRAVAAGAQVHGGAMGQMADQFWGDRCGT